MRTFFTMVGLALLAVTSAKGKGDGAEPLYFAAIPDENNITAAERYRKTQSYLSRELGRPVKVVEATDYTAVIEAMRRKRADLAWFGPFSYYLARKNADVEAFALGVRDGKTFYRSLFVVKQESDVQKLADLRGRKVAFTDPASTSGNLVPTYTIVTRFNQQPEEFFSELVYAGGHDSAAYALVNGNVDAAVLAEDIFQRMEGDGRLPKGALRVIYQSDPIPSAPLTYRSDLAPALKKAIQQAFLTAHEKIDVRASGFGSDIDRFQAASHEDFALIGQLVEVLDLDLGS